MVTLEFDDDLLGSIRREVAGQHQEAEEYLKSALNISEKVRSPVNFVLMCLDIRKK